MLTSVTKFPLYSRHLKWKRKKKSFLPFFFSSCSPNPLIGLSFPVLGRYRAEALAHSGPPCCEIRFSIGKNEKLKRLKKNKWQQTQWGEAGGDPADWQRSHLSTWPEWCRRRGIKELALSFCFFFIFTHSSFTSTYAGVKTPTDPPWRRNQAEEHWGKEGKQGSAHFWAHAAQRAALQKPASQPPPLRCHGDGSFHFLFIIWSIYLFWLIF